MEAARTCLVRNIGGIPVLRLFGLAGLLFLAVAILALSTGSWIYRIATLLLAFTLFLLYWFLRRGLPRTRGTLTLPGLHAQVEVYWEDRGVPHIYARNLHDLYMAQGYVTAQDHLWSMDLDRRAASGRLAEVLGAKLLPLDKHFRTLGLRRAAADSLELYQPETRAHLDAYAAGVNARIAEGKLPPEFALLFYRPDPWTAVDTLSIGKYAAYGLGGNWEGELLRAQLVQAVGAEKAAELFWQKPDVEALQALEELPLPDVGGLLAIAAQTMIGATSSNAWVVAGSKSRTGAPILANDLHLPVRSPSIWYQTHLVGPDMDVSGVTFPGLPGILLGRNGAIAWGTAGLAADVQDLYIEQVSPTAPDHFLYQEHWEQAESIREEIRVRGSHQPVIHDVLITRHGPVIARNDQIALSLRWSALTPSSDLESVLAINRAQSWDEFKQALAPLTAPAQNYLFAGRDGTIGWKAAGRIPIRASGDGQAPVPGWTGQNEWRGFIPFAELPEAFNPPDGFIVCANQDMTPGGYPHQLGTGWAPAYRAARIAECLRGASALSIERMQTIQADTLSLQARTLLQSLLGAVQEGLYQGVHPEALNPTEKAALLTISGWDGNESADSPAAALWHQWYSFLIESIFRPQMGLELFDQFVTCGMPLQVADRLLRQVAEGGDSRWLSREGEHGFARIALRSYRRAVALLAAKYGGAPERWRWGAEHRIRFEHPLTLRFGFLKPLLNLGPYPVGGSSTTVNLQGYSQLNPFQVNVGASWRHIADLSVLDESKDASAPGQSGHPFSPHHGDQISAWLRGEYQAQLRRHDDIRKLHCLLLEPHGSGGQRKGTQADAAD